MPYVQLSRRFSEFVETKDQDEAAEMSLRHFGMSEELSWSELLKNRFIIVLGEAGTGKTMEFKAQVRALNSSGHSAFFIPLEDLADRQLSPATGEQLEQWKTRSEKGVLFLDAVDEARLRQPAALRRALNHLVSIVEPHGGRANVLMSCRVSDWRFRTDAKEIQLALGPFAQADIHEDDAAETFAAYQGSPPTQETQSLLVEQPGDQTPELQLKLVKLNPLKSDQIARLASAWGVSPIADFMTALADRGLDVFATRPRDLEWLVEYWREHQDFGDLADMIELNIEQKLREHSSTREQLDQPISAKRAREGVETLAAASILCEKPMIAIPDPEIQQSLPLRSFWPREVLTDWTDREIGALLARPIFDPSTLGRVRFHDPMVRDFLAAEWLARRHANGAPLAKLRMLVFGDAFGTTLAIRSKRPVLGWLAAKIPEVRREAVTVAPDVILYCGDAKQIPVEEKGQALRILANRERRFGRTDWIVYRSDIQRIVDSQLDSTVYDLLRTEAESNEIASLLLRMVALGQLTKSAELALAIATDSKNSNSTRVAAAQAVVASGSAEQKFRLLGYVRNATNLSNRLLGGFCGALFPDVLNVSACIELARRGQPERADISGGLAQSFRYEIVEDCPSSDLPTLLNGLLALTREEPLISLGGERLVSEHFIWVLVPISHLFTRLLKVVREQDYPISDLVDAYILLDRCRELPDLYISGSERLRKELATHLVLHQPVYWGVVRNRLHRRPNGIWFGWHLTEETLVLSREDLSWLIADATLLSDAREIQIVFDTATRIWHMEGRSESIAQSIIDAVSQSHASEDLKQRILDSFDPIPREETPREREHRERRSQREQAERTAIEQARAAFADRIDQIRAGQDFSALFYLHGQMRHSKTANLATWAQANWRSLIPSFGEPIAEAARDGFKLCWRSWSPPFPFEKEEQHRVENAVPIGLTGLTLVAESDGNFQAFTHEEVEIAIKYAMRELNGFPDWMEGLVRRHPSIVRSVLARQLVVELSAHSDGGDPGDLLASVKHGPAIVQQLCAETVMAQLTQSEPSRAKALTDALDILAASSRDVRAQLGSLASDRAEAHLAVGDDESMLAWIFAWLRVDGTAAWQFVERVVANRNECPSPFVLNLAARFSRFLSINLSINDADFLRPRVLGRMIQTVYAHVRPEDDSIQLGLYTPNTRDMAQEFRGWMPQFLSEQSGPEAQETLVLLSNELESPNSRVWMASLADRQAAKLIEYPPWQTSQVAEFCSIHERSPISASDLFEITIDRLNDIKDDIEHGDFSDRGLFQPTMAEHLIQRWLAGRLERESRRRYSIVREEEVDRREKTDIRLHNPSAGMVTIEIKPVESGTGRYTFNQLVDAIERQLVGQYLRESTARHGILLVAMLQRRHWNLPEGIGRIDFLELIDRLSTKAQSVAESNREVDDLRVIGIDFTYNGRS